MIDSKKLNDSFTTTSALRRIATIFNKYCETHLVIPIQITYGSFLKFCFAVFPIVCLSNLSNSCAVFIAPRSLVFSIIFFTLSGVFIGHSISITDKT